MKRKIILMGPPGSGKGTQAKKLAAEWSIPHISTGDMLRDAVREGTELGREAAPIMASGDLVPDDLMVGIVGERFEKPDTASGFILDGFPRTAAQASKLVTLLEARNGDEGFRVVHLSVPDDVIVRRLSGRRNCAGCGAIYHLENNPPAVVGVCDRCGGNLVERTDDGESSVRRRLEEYRSQTLPVIDFYRERSEYHKVDGVGSVDEIFERIERALER